MPTLSVQTNQPLFPRNTSRIKAGQEIAAAEAARKDGADNLFFRVERDTYVASGRGMDLQKLKAGDGVVFDGRRGTVVTVDDELNSAGDGIRQVGRAVDRGTKVTGASGGVAGAILAAAAVQTTTGFGAVLAPVAIAGGVGLGVGAGLLVGGAAGTVVTAVSAARGALKRADLEALRTYAE